MRDKGTTTNRVMRAYLEISLASMGSRFVMTKTCSPLLGDFFERLLTTSRPRLAGESNGLSSFGVMVLLLLTDDSVDESGDVMHNSLSSSAIFDKSIGGSSLMDFRAALDAIIWCSSSSSSRCAENRENNFFMRKKLDSGQLGSAPYYFLRRRKTNLINNIETSLKKFHGRR